MSTSHSDSQENPYQSFHWASIATSAIALTAPLCLVTPAFAFIPVLAIVVGVFGYFTISSAPEIYHGIKLTVIGTMTSLLLLVWSVTGMINKSDYYYDVAFDNTITWLTYLKEDELPAAHQVMISVEHRQHDVQILNQYYGSNKGIYDDMLLQFTKQPINLLLAKKDKWNPQDLILVENKELLDLKKNKMRVVQHYHLPLSDPPDGVISFQMQYLRVYDPAGRASQWQLEYISEGE
jgi:hypothetical protein|tara:strand:+ start:1442 stop:2149 length:708 start_codon:yes stop_codon:yes gene_type:complete